MTADQIRIKINQYLVKGDIEDALDFLILCLDNLRRRKDYDDAIILRTKWENLKRDNLLDLISNEDRKFTESRIIKGIQIITNKIDHQTVVNIPEPPKKNILIIKNISFFRAACISILFFIIIFITYKCFFKKNHNFDYPIIEVRGGQFKMGNTVGNSNSDSDECSTEIQVKDFKIGKYEVTQLQWEKIMGDNPSKYGQCDDCPVENVSWDKVQTFIQKLNTITGQKYRLPTESEWEYAAKGGMESMKDNFKYSGSNNLDEVAWFADNSGNRTHKVGRKSPNKLGIYDMSGNVWELCQDDYVRYPNCNGSAKTGKVTRGGSVTAKPFYCRSSLRGIQRSDTGTHILGFRLVKE